MNVKIEDIVESVLIRLDESPELLDDAIEYGSESFDLRSMVRSLLIEEAEMVIATAENEDFGEWLAISESALEIKGNGYEAKQILPLPSDFMRLVFLKMSDWDEVSTRLLPSHGAVASLLRHWSRHRREGFKSNGMALTYKDGRRALEIFGSRAGSYVESGGYIPQPTMEDDYLIFPPSLRDRLIERIVETIKKIRG